MSDSRTYPLTSYTGNSQDVPGGKGTCMAMTAQPTSRHTIPAYNARRKHTGVTHPTVLSGKSLYPSGQQTPPLHHVHSARPSISQGPSDPTTAHDCARPSSKIEKCPGLRSDHPRPDFCSDILGDLPGLSFFICNMGRLTVPASALL